MDFNNHRMPIWFNADGTEHQRIRASSCSVDLSVNDIPKATLTMASDDDIPDTHALIELFKGNDSLGLFRVVSYGYTYHQQTVLQLMGAVDFLEDYVYESASDSETTKTASAWITDILNKQSVKRWQLGTCALTGNVAIKLNYQTLWTLLEEVRNSQTGYAWQYNFESNPWTLNLVKLPTTTAASFRVTRNVESAKVNVTDQDLFNRLICNVNNADGTTTRIVKNDTASQTQYGIRTRCTDIKADQLPSGMTADAYATSLLNEHSQPVSNIQISGADLSKLTGNSFDKIALGSQCEVVLPGYNMSMVERVMAINYPDVLGTPEKLTAQLSTEIKPITGTLGNAKQLAAAVKATRGGGGGGGSGKAETTWAKVLTETIEAVDGTGIVQLWQSGIEASAQGGTRVFSVYQGMESMSSEIKTNASQITMKVSKGDVATQLAIEVGNVTISKANLLVLDGYITTQGLEAAKAEIAQQMSEGITTGELQVEGTSYLNKVDLSSMLFNGTSVRVRSFYFNNVKKAEFIGTADIRIP